MKEYKPLIEATIKTLKNQFRRKPYNFFNEHEFHQYTYHTFYCKKEFSRQYETLDGKKTNILKPEYPSIKRFSRKEPKVMEKGGSRAHYDMAILNPEFIQNKNYNTVRNRDIRHSHDGAENLIAAMEFKYVTKHSKGFHHEVACDLLKLSVADEAWLKYFLFFVNAPARGEIDYFDGVDVPEGVVIHLITAGDSS